MKRMVIIIMGLFLMAFCGCSEKVDRSLERNQHDDTVITGASECTTNESEQLQEEDTTPTVSTENAEALQKEPVTYSYYVECADVYIQTNAWENIENRYVVLEKPELVNKIAQLLILENPDFSEYLLEKSVYDPVEKVWDVRFCNPENAAEILTMRLERDSGRFVSALHTDASNNTYPVECSQTTVSKETAIEMVDAMCLAWEKLSFEGVPFTVHELFYLEKEGYWIARAWPPRIASSYLLTVIIDEKNGAVVNAWDWDRGWEDSEMVIYGNRETIFRSISVVLVDETER